MRCDSQFSIMRPTRQTRMNPMWTIFWISTSIKLLLIPSYYSTDFEVHRNWLAITHSLPISKWYHESTSEWTLDYPPFFGWFEWCISQIAQFIDPEMLKISNLNYASSSTVLYQRVTVILTDLVYYLGIFMYCSTWSDKSTLEIASTKFKFLTVASISIFNAGLFLVDHIHFQYNGFLLGLLLISVSFIRNGEDVKGAVTYAILLMFKHIYLYVSLLYFVYLLRHYCWRPIHSSEEKYIRQNKNENRRRSRTLSQPENLSIHRKFSLSRFIYLGSSVLIVFGLALFPMLLPLQNFFANGQQFLLRLFPIGRGLCHAYWAPNVWAIYSFFDKVGSLLMEKLTLTARMGSVAAMTGGLVGVSSFTLLPNIPPILTAVFTILVMMPVLVGVWKFPHPGSFMPALVYCMFCSYMLGYHVHEKAILQVVVPMGLSAAESAYDARLYCLTSVISTISLFPLLFTPMEDVTKILIFIVSSVFNFIFLDAFIKESLKKRYIRGNGIVFHIFEVIYLVGLVILCSLGLLVTKIESSILTKYPFLPLMLLSTYCAIGLVYVWILSLVQYRRKNIAIEAYLASPVSQMQSSNSEELLPEQLVSQFSLE